MLEEQNIYFQKLLKKNLKKIKRLILKRIRYKVPKVMSANGGKNQQMTKKENPKKNHQILRNQRKVPKHLHEELAGAKFQKKILKKVQRMILKRI